MNGRKKIGFDRYCENYDKALRYVKKSGDELVVYDRKGPIAIITPFRAPEVEEIAATSVENDHDFSITPGPLPQFPDFPNYRRRPHSGVAYKELPAGSFATGRSGWLGMLREMAWPRIETYIPFLTRS